MSRNWTMTDLQAAKARMGQMAAKKEEKVPESKRLNIEGEELNKTERAFLEFLQAQAVLKGAWILTQPVKLVLAHKCTYTPDFVTVELLSAAMPSKLGAGLSQPVQLTAWEVKGFWRDDARVKIKVAARMYPWIRFIAVQKARGGWKEELIQP